jgi:phosphoribosyl-AMP cyclohydrolase
MKIRLIIYFICFITPAFFSQNRWMKLNGPEGGVVTGLFAIGDTLLAGAGYSGSIYYSTDRGSIWKQAQFSGGVRDFIASNANSFVAACYSNGLYYSLDINTWSKISISGNFYSVGKDQRGNLFAGTFDGKILLQQIME